MTDTTTTTTIDPDETPQGTADGRTVPEPGQGTDPDPGRTTGADDRTPNEGQPDSEPDSDDLSPGAEAARYRRRLRDTEAERDALAEQLEASRRAFVDHLLDTVVGLEVPDGFWAAGTELADLLGDDGAVDVAKVKAAAIHAKRTLGLKSRGDRSPDRTLGRDITPAKVSPSWSDALR